MGCQEGCANSLRRLRKSRKADAMADPPPQPVSSPAITAEIAGNRIELIESGAERLRLLLELIGGAQQSIKMLMYMFNPDRAGEKVRDALAATAKRGVQVKLLIDGFGS